MDSEKSKYCTLFSGIEIYFACGLLLASLWILTACNKDSDTWQRIQESGTIRIGLDPTFPPFEWIEQDVLKGIDVDLSDSLADELGVQANFTYFGYDGLYDALYTDHVDVIISAMVILPERTRDFAYSDVYFDAGQVIISPSSNQFSEPEELLDHLIAVELGAAGHVYVKQLQRQNHNLVIKPYRSVDEVLDALVEGEVDAAIVDSITGRLFASEVPGFSTSNLPATSEPYAIVTRRDSQELLEQLNGALEKLNSNGTLDRILARWLNGAVDGNDD
jgi:polar amino acid transport system substrate-binding protein